MFVARFSLAPGAGFPLEASDPTGGMVVVESGAFTVRVEEMAWMVNRGEALRAAMAEADETSDLSAAMEQVAMGEEAVLEAGDVAWVPGSVSGEIRNDGQEPAEGLVFLVGPPAAMSEATPAPSDRSPPPGAGSHPGPLFCRLFHGGPEPALVVMKDPMPPARCIRG